MKIFNTIFLFVLVIAISAGAIFLKAIDVSENYGAPAFVEEEVSTEHYTGIFGDLSNWVRPEGPLRVGLQVGHWKNSELPDELHKLRDSSGGTSSGRVTEWEVNLSIAEKAKKILEKEGIVVDILPATIPPAYYADAIVAVHADGNTNPSTSGFKVAAPRRNMSGKSDELVKIIENVYQEQTNLDIDPNISRNMTGYYAFNWRRYEYSTHPMAPAVILETGFLTNPIEARMLINNPELPANAIAEALIRFLSEEMSL